MRELALTAQVREVQGASAELWFCFHPQPLHGPQVFMRLCAAFMVRRVQVGKFFGHPADACPQDHPAV